MKSSLVCEDRRRLRGASATFTGTPPSLHRLSARPDPRCGYFDCCNGGRWSSDPADKGPDPSGEQNSSLIFLLDRDCELRRHYLKRRWQGVSS